jgi:hypothetical protein
MHSRGNPRLLYKNDIKSPAAQSASEDARERVDVAASTPLDVSKTWMAGTSPAMTRYIWFGTANIV